MPDGEDAKTLRVYETLLHQLATQEAHRDDPVIALGGGAVGDLAGFVASTYMRGVPFIQVPTTLLAQVDAAIGGKAAVNLPEGKNLVGTFSQPRLVVADVDTLATLPEREFRSGLAEVAKYALTLDLELLDMLERDPGPVLARDPATLERLVARCVAAKARTVAEDERDDGRRLVLNYGHTLGHALERLDAFAGRSHGEAVAVGMVFAARLAEARGHGVRRPRHADRRVCSRRSAWRPTARCRVPTTSSRRSGSTRSIEVVFASCSWRTSGGPWSWTTSRTTSCARCCTTMGASV